jgi:hypothetical protein
MEKATMSTWLHNLPTWEMGLVVFAATCLAGTMIHLLTARLAVGPHMRSMKTVSPGLLSPLGVLFGLFVAFIAAQVWNDADRANAAVDMEASALKDVIVVSTALPKEAELQLRVLVRDYIENATATEWPMMARGTATLKVTPAALNDALRLTLSMPANTPGLQTAQRQITTSLEQALDARRQRILISQSEVNIVKWACVIWQAVFLLLTIGLIHCDDRLASAIAIGVFSAAVATSMLLILSHDRPFAGEFAVKPDPLIQVVPAAS